MNELIKSTQEIKAMRECGRILANSLQSVEAAVVPGISTSELNAIAEAKLKELGGKPSFLGYMNEQGEAYPATLCASVNSAVVHGIPNKQSILKEGDIVGIDLGCWYEGLCTDMAMTVPVGKVSPQAKKLIKVTRQALEIALKQVRNGAFVGDIGEAVQSFVEHEGFSVVRALTGHGVGRALHEEPAIPNFGKSSIGQKLRSGMTVAIEPMVNEGDYEVKTLDDGWTVMTADGSLSAHFEHTVLVTDNGFEILTKV